MKTVQPTRWTSLTPSELDAAVVAGFTQSFRTEINSDEVRTVLPGRSELLSITVFAPKLWSFQHRHSLSLRHPRVSYFTWAHRIVGGKPRSELYSAQEVLFPLSLPEGAGGGKATLSMSNDSMTSTEALLTDSSEAGRLWGIVGSVHEVLLNATPEAEEARRRLGSDPLVFDMISRFWHRLVDVEEEERNMAAAAAGSSADGATTTGPLSDDAASSRGASAARNNNKEGGGGSLSARPTPQQQLALSGSNLLRPQTTASGGGGGGGVVAGRLEQWLDPEALGKLPKGRMTPMQYLYLQHRMTEVLLPNVPLAVLDLLDIAERDLCLDLYRQPRPPTAASSTVLESSALRSLAALQTGSSHHTGGGGGGGGHPVGSEDSGAFAPPPLSSSVGMGMPFDEAPFGGSSSFERGGGGGGGGVSTAEEQLGALFSDPMYPESSWLEMINELHAMEDEESALRAKRSESVVSGGTGAADMVYGPAYQEQSYHNPRRVRDYRKYPSLSFYGFAMSMLELADNWTSTTSPAEAAAFLADLHENIFTRDWSAEADYQIIKAALRHRSVVFGEAPTGVGGGGGDGSHNPMGHAPVAPAAARSGALPSAAGSASGGGPHSGGGSAGGGGLVTFTGDMPLYQGSTAEFSVGLGAAERRRLRRESVSNMLRVEDGALMTSEQLLQIPTELREQLMNGSLPQLLVEPPADDDPALENGRRKGREGVVVSPLKVGDVARPRRMERTGVRSADGGMLYSHGRVQPGTVTHTTIPQMLISLTTETSLPSALEAVRHTSKKHQQPTVSASMVRRANNTSSTAQPNMNHQQQQQGMPPRPPTTQQQQPPLVPRRPGGPRTANDAEAANLLLLAQQHDTKIVLTAPDP